MSTKPKIRASDAANDIRSGMKDSELMEKYGLSAKGLHSLFLKLLEVRAITQSELNRRSANYHDTAIIGRMNPGSVVEDIRAGMSDSELMNKYSLSSEGLRRAFERLLEAKVIAPDDLYGASSYPFDSVSVENRREVPRFNLANRVVIYEVKHPEIKGVLTNIAEKGIAITGIGAAIGDYKTFIIPAVSFVQIDPIRFDAECKWGGQDAITGEWRCGFEIMNISRTCWDDLKRLVQTVSFPA
jgi:uncharacterized protein (DUF433 family)